VTLADVEGPAPSAFTVLAVHGLPEEGVPPETQLEPIKQAFQLPASSWHDHIWCRDPTRMSVGRVVRRLTRREFATYYTDREWTEADRDPEPFTPWLKAHLASLAPQTPIILIAYSGGALIVYKWLATRATREEMQRLAAIVCLAGPYNFPQAVQTIGFAHKPELTIDVQEETIDPALITRYLRPWQLVVLLGSEDVTVLPVNASFEPTLPPNLIDEHVIPGAEHHTICGDPATLAYLRTRFFPFADAIAPESEEVARLSEPEART
jgi:hypothetical protein